MLETVQNIAIQDDAAFTIFIDTLSTLRKRVVLMLLQECHLALAKHQNVHLLQVERLVRSGGLWASPALQAILSESSLPQSEGRL